MALNDLASALRDLKERLEDQGFKPGIAEFVAHEWEVNPELLIRKFTESEGVSPEHYDISAAIAARAEHAAREARALSLNFATSARHVDIDGRTVEITGLMIRTVTRRRIVVVAMTREAIMGIDINVTTRGNPMEKFLFREEFGGRDKLIEQLAAAAEGAR